MELPHFTRVNSEEETSHIAGQFAQILRKGDIIALYGNLGTGKTFFVQKVCELYDIHNAHSPTFSIVHEYSGKIKIYHFDFYRINKLEELFDIGFEEYLNDDTAITFIEWADLMPEILPSKRIEVRLKFIEEFSREIKINRYV